MDKVMSTIKLVVDILIKVAVTAAAIYLAFSMFDHTPSSTTKTPSSTTANPVDFAVDIETYRDSVPYELYQEQRHGKDLALIMLGAAETIASKDNATVQANEILSRITPYRERYLVKPTTIYFCDSSGELTGKSEQLPIDTVVRVLWPSESRLIPGFSEQQVRVNIIQPDDSEISGYLRPTHISLCPPAQYPQWRIAGGNSQGWTEMAVVFRSSGEVSDWLPLTVRNIKSYDYRMGDGIQVGIQVEGHDWVISDTSKPVEVPAISSPSRVRLKLIQGAVGSSVTIVREFK